MKKDGFFQVVREDLKAVRRFDPEEESSGPLRIVFSSNSFRACIIHRVVSETLWLAGLHILGRCAARFGWFLTGTYIHPSVKLGKGVMIGRGTIINFGTIIEDGVIIGSRVTIGGFHFHKGMIQNGLAKIGARATIESGVSITGLTYIGPEAHILAGSTVFKNVWSGSTVESVQEVINRTKDGE